ncbi:MAG: protein kinase [Clostridiales bacterium]|nr:protein kinase [Clostridiales bacterium]
MIRMEMETENRAWPEWKLVRQIGRGSFGRVYEAVRRDYQIENRAAIKVISIPQPELEMDSLFSEGLGPEATRTCLLGVVNDCVREIELLEAFKGMQNIVSVEDYKVLEKTDEIGWDIYIRMELLTPFPTYISDKTLTEQEVIRLGCDICTALEICAKKNVIHRDVKPENIFSHPLGHFKLGDFGIARQLEPMAAGLSRKGTANYMAPEVERGLNYDATVDLYSLGLVLYALLNNKRQPFLDIPPDKLPTYNERILAWQRRMNGEALPPPCNASPGMAEVIRCACAYDPRRRFQSATAMKNALTDLLTEKSAGKGHSSISPGSESEDAGRGRVSADTGESRAEVQVQNPDKITKDLTEPGKISRDIEKKETDQVPVTPVRDSREKKKSKIKWLIPVCVAAVFIVMSAYYLSEVRNNRIEIYNSLIGEQKEYLAAGDADGEEAVFEQAAEIYPSGMETYYLHACMLYDEQDYSACIDFIDADVLQNSELDLTQDRMADVYYLYADSYFQLGAYDNAVETYESLFRIGTEETAYYRDYAIALACAGNTTRAQKILEEAEGLGLEDDGIYYTKGEIEKAESDYDAALEAFQSCLQMTSDADLEARAYLACAFVYEAQGDLESEREILLEAERAVGSDNQKLNLILQELIQTDIDLANASASTFDSSLYREEAIDRLNQVIENGWSTFTTYNTLTVQYQKLGELELAQETLDSVADIYSTDYRLYKRYAFLEVAKQESLDSQDKDYTQFQEYYEQAVELYEDWLREGNASDSEMDTLAEQYEDVRNAGWLS